MKKIEATMQEIYEAMRPNIYRNRRRYTRKTKHKKKPNESEDQRLFYSITWYNDYTNHIINSINK